MAFKGLQMKRVEFNEKMSQANDEISAMPQETPWDRFVRNLSRQNLWVADNMAEEFVDDERDE